MLKKEYEESILKTNIASEYYSNQLAEIQKKYEACKKDIYLQSIRLMMEKNLDVYQRLVSCYNSNLDKISFYESEVKRTQEESSMIEKRISNLEELFEKENKKNFILRFFHREKRKDIKNYIQKGKEKLQGVYYTQSKYTSLLEKEKERNQKLRNVLEKIYDHYKINEAEFLKIMSLSVDRKQLKVQKQQNDLRFKDMEGYRTLIALIEKEKNQIEIDYVTHNEDSFHHNQLVEKIYMSQYDTGFNLYENPGSNIEKYQAKMDLYQKDNKELEAIYASSSNNDGKHL